MLHFSDLPVVPLVLTSSFPGGHCCQLESQGHHAESFVLGQAGLVGLS